MIGWSSCPTGPPNSWGTHWLDLITVPQKPNNSAAIAAPQMTRRTNAFKSDLRAMASTCAKRPCHPAPRRPNKDLRFASGARGRYAVMFGPLEVFILVAPRQSKKWWRQRSTGRPMSERMLPLPCCWCSWRLGLMLRGSEPWRAWPARAKDSRASSSPWTDRRTSTPSKRRMGRGR